MIPGAEVYPFVPMSPAAGALGLLPLLPISLELQRRSVSVLGLLDTAATVSVLPHDVGLQLGAVWEQQTTTVQLTGNLAAVEARGLIVAATVGRFPPVRLVFAWARVNAIPVILGQVNFFLEFDAYFSRSSGVFEVKPK
jgi:hypothetical protein